MTSTAEIDLRRLFGRSGPASALTRLEKAWKSLDIGAERRQVLDRIRDLSSPLLLFIVGEGNFGKSTLINALLGEPAAPVSVLPCTWKVDVYQRCGAEQAPGAALRWRGRKDEQHVDMDQAREAVAEQERQSRERAQSRSDAPYVSKLLQVRWTSPSYELPEDVALVDTPGFSQLRSDVALEDVHVRSANGILVTARQSFDYWYHRSDVVLWVFKATRLNDRDTIDALSRLSKHGRTILGAVTHMDRVPEDQWAEVMQRARELFGPYVDELYPVVGKPDAPGHADTIGALRADIVERFFADARTHKEEALNQFLSRSGNRLVRWVATERDAMLRNIDVLSKTRISLQNTRFIKQRFTAEAIAKWRNDHMKAALGRCAAGFSQLPADDAELQSMMTDIIRPGPACQSLSNELETILSQAAGEFRDVSRRLDLVGVRLGEEDTEVFVQPPDLHGSTSIQISGGGIGARIDDVLTGYEGLAAGFGAGAIGAALLGPVGWGLAIVGLLMGDEIKRGELRDHTKKQIESWFPVTAQQTLDRVHSKLQSLHSGADDALVAAFRQFCGDPPAELESRCRRYERQILKPLVLRPPSLLKRIWRLMTAPVRAVLRESPQKRVEQA